MARKQEEPRFAVKYPYDREELNNLLSDLFDKAIQTRDAAQETSSGILRLKEALDKGYLNHLTEKNKDLA